MSVVSDRLNSVTTHHDQWGGAGLPLNLYITTITTITPVTARKYRTKTLKQSLIRMKPTCFIRSVILSWLVWKKCGSEFPNRPGRGRVSNARRDSLLSLVWGYVVNDSADCRWTAVWRETVTVGRPAGGYTSESYVTHCHACCDKHFRTSLTNCSSRNIVVIYYMINNIILYYLSVYIYRMNICCWDFFTKKRILQKTDLYFLKFRWWTSLTQKNTTHVWELKIFLFP